MANRKSASGTSSESTRASLQQGRPRDRKRATGDSSERIGAGPVNSIRMAPVRQSQAEKGSPAPTPAEETRTPSAERSRTLKATAKEELSVERDPFAVPGHVQRRFVQVGRRYYFPDGARAFTDRGHRLTTASENTEVIKSLVDIANTRGWQEIIVHGSERFQREAWFTAKTAGIEVRGYKPSRFEEGKLVRSLAERQTPERRVAPLPALDPSRSEGPVQSHNPPLWTGKLLEHGRAPYKQDPKEPMSYFVRIETTKGERTYWGVDLERAFKESLTQPQTGDAIGISTSRKDPVTIKVAERNADGEVSGQKSLETHRNRWVVEKQAFFESRARAARALLDSTISPRQAVKTHPELVGTYLQLKAAELAAKKLRHPEDRQQFVDRMRSALAEVVARGEPLPKVRMKDKIPLRRAPRSTEQSHVR